MVVEHALGQFRAAGSSGGNVADVEPELPSDAPRRAGLGPALRRRPLRFRALSASSLSPAHHLVRRQSHDLSPVDSTAPPTGCASLSARSATPRPGRRPPPTSPPGTAGHRQRPGRRAPRAHRRHRRLPLYDRLADARRGPRAMQRNRQTPVSPGVELLERLAELRDALPDRVESATRAATASSRTPTTRRWRSRTPGARDDRSRPQRPRLRDRDPGGLCRAEPGPEVARRPRGAGGARAPDRAPSSEVERVTVFLEPSSNPRPALERACHGRVPARCRPSSAA